MSDTQTTKSSIFRNREKKELTPAQKKWKTAGSWIVNIICIAIIIFTLIVSIQTVIRTTNEDGVANLFGTAFMPVKTDSMSGTFEKGDVILCDVYKGDGFDLKVGQVITFKTSVLGTDKKFYESFNTHRISRIEAGRIYTKGDKAGLSEDSSAVLANQIVATWGSVGEDGTLYAGKVWAGMGKLSNWLEDPVVGRTRFFCAIVLPLILLFVIYAFVLIRTLVIAKLDKAKAEAAAAAANVSADSLSEEDKRRLAEEYLASLAQSGGSRASEGDAPTEATAGETENASEQPEGFDKDGRSK